MAAIEPAGAAAARDGRPAVAPGPLAPPALEAVGLSSGYAGNPVLREVSLTVPSGGVVALLGANGAGKTTVLRTVSGLIRPTAGTVRLAGADVTAARPYQRAARGLCHLPEGRGIFRNLTVLQNLQLQSRPGQEREAVDRAAAAFPFLRDRLQQVAGTLSGGQQQMLALAAAHLRRPELILVDEPSLGLAPRVVSEIFEFLHELAGTGVSLLVVDQFVAQVLRIAGHVYVLQRGRVVFQGSPEQLRAESVFERYLGD